MAYNPTDWKNGETGIGESKLNKIEQGIKDLDDNKIGKTGNVLVYKGIIPDGSNIDDLKTTGLYYTSNSAIVNIPDDIVYNWIFVAVLSNEGSGTVEQYLLGRNYIYMRNFSGTPGTWKDWLRVTKGFVNLINGRTITKSTGKITLREDFSKYKALLFQLGGVGDYEFQSVLATPFGTQFGYDEFNYSGWRLEDTIKLNCSKGTNFATITLKINSMTELEIMTNAQSINIRGIIGIL